MYIRKISGSKSHKMPTVLRVEWGFLLPFLMIKDGLMTLYMYIEVCSVYSTLIIILVNAYHLDSSVNRAM